MESDQQYRVRFKWNGVTDTTPELTRREMIDMIAEQGGNSILEILRDGKAINSEMTLRFLREAGAFSK